MLHASDREVTMMTRVLTGSALAFAFALTTADVGCSAATTVASADPQQVLPAPPDPTVPTPPEPHPIPQPRPGPTYTGDPGPPRPPPR